MKSNQLAAALQQADQQYRLVGVSFDIPTTERQWAMCESKTHVRKLAALQIYARFADAGRLPFSGATEKPPPQKQRRSRLAELRKKHPLADNEADALRDLGFD